jgi:hypothetical protein
MAGKPKGETVMMARIINWGMWALWIGGGFVLLLILSRSIREAREAKRNREILYHIRKRLQE